MKKVIFTLVIVFATTISFAQNTSNDSIKSKVREIKLSEKYVYAESGSMTDFAEAKLAVAEKLHAVAINLMAEHQKGKEEMKNLWTKAEKQEQFIEYTNGPLFKVLAYIPKNSLVETPAQTETKNNTEAKAEAETKTETEKNETPTSSPQPTLSIAPITEDTLSNASSAVKADSIIQIVSQQTGQPIVRKDSIIQQEKTYNVDENTAALILKMLPIAESKTSTTKKQDAQPATDIPQTTTTTKNKEELTAKPAETIDPWAGVSENTRRILTDLLAMETYESAMIYLNAMKEDGRLMFGSLKKIIMPERSYLLIVKDGKVETVLGKGTGERTNLKSLEQESIRKYIGYGIIWIQVFDKN